MKAKVSGKIARERTEMIPDAEEPVQRRDIQIMNADDVQCGQRQNIAKRQWRILLPSPKLNAKKLEFYLIKGTMSILYAFLFY